MKPPLAFPRLLVTSLVLTWSSVGLALPRAVQAQADESAVTHSGADTLIALVPVRSGAEIQRNLDGARASRDAADAALRRATDLRDRSRLRIEVQKKEISTLQSRLKLAKKEKNQAEAGRLAEELKRMKLRQELLERRAELRGAEIDLAKTLKALAEATASAHERELELAAERDQRFSLAVDTSNPVLGAQIAASEARIRTLEERVLAAQKTEAERRMEAAKREGKLAERRKKLFEAQLKLLGHGKS